MNERPVDLAVIVMAIILTLILACCTYLIANLFFKITFAEVFFLEIVSVFGRNFLNFISRKVLPTKL
jgi:hypothetical protein